MSSYRFAGPDLSFTGNTNQQLGTSVAYGDIDGDGITDYVIGGFRDATLSSGSDIYIISGNALAAADAADGTTDFDIDLELATGIAGVWRINDPAQQTTFGSSLGLGDFDGDNRLDLIVGAAFDDTAGTNYGAAYLFYGANLGGMDALDGTIDGVISATNASFTFYGDQSNGNLGYTVGALDQKFTNTGAGDEIMITAPYTDSGADINEGSIWLVSSDDLDRLDLLDGVQDQKITLDDGAALANPIIGTTLLNGDGSGERMGIDAVDVGKVFESVAGFHQLLLGGDGATGGVGIAYLITGVELGATDIADGVADGILQGEFLGAGGAAYRFVGDVSPREEGIGIGLGTPGDINGDGLNELLIAGTDSDAGEVNGGVVYLLMSNAIDLADGLDGVTDLTIDLTRIAGLETGGAIVGYRLIGDIRDGALGADIATAGDIDGDGQGDFILGAPGRDGQAYIVTAASLTAADAADGATDGDITMSNLVAQDGNFMIQGSTTASALASSIEFVGDVDIDAVGDFFIGDPLLDVGQFDIRGGAVLVSGAELRTLDAMDGTQDGVVSIDYINDQTTGANVTGSDGDDLLLGRDGSDVLDGGLGFDTLRGRDGADTLIGGDDDDFIFGGATTSDLRDVVYAGDGNDSVDGGYGNDSLFGGNGNDTIAGSFGADTVIGNAGDDVLTGSAFSDQIFGNDGMDFINGGFGYDRVNGGTGADRFYHLGTANHGFDWVQDYTATDGDVIMYGGGAGAATAGDFLVQFAETTGAGAAGVKEAFITHIPSGNVLWALIDGEAQSSINIQTNGVVTDLLA